jgi:hypothetical protein
MEQVAFFQAGNFGSAPFNQLVRHGRLQSGIPERAFYGEAGRKCNGKSAEPIV